MENITLHRKHANDYTKGKQDHMTSSLDVSLILPCFQEMAVFHGSMEAILKTLTNSPFSFEIIFVDDGSTDGTRGAIQTVCKNNPHCRYIFHAKNQGRGAAVTTGFRSATGNIVGYIDIDCEVSPVYIPEIVTMIQSGLADVVVGKRIYRTSFSSLIREILSVGYRKLADWIIHTGGIDTESGYKFFHRKKFMPVLKEIKDQRWFWDTESIVRSREHGLVIKEVPVLFLRRFDKVSSVHIISDTMSYIQDMWKFRKGHN